MLSPEEQYRKINQTTAGALKCQQLLLERAIVLCEQYTEGDLERVVKVQNILSQLQISLDIRYEVARDLHKAYAVLWDVMDLGDPDGVLGVADVLRTHLETVLTLEGLEKSRS